MYLKRLELHGFKSFAPRTVLEFSPGTTAIVGPNGAGKSNVADAIRWVLGEQSMRQLRGRKSDDVIFVGGQGRGAMQMAEVGLVLDNSAAWLPSEYSEVTATRRSYRSGESEYLINGQRVRLKDVLMLLAQARIGHDSYTIIGQGMVDQALSARADERRALFEDAAGIRQFQTQRTDAEQKLTLTQSNLGRLADILGEIEPRLAPLAEQARRAREYAGASDELARQLRVWYRTQWRDLQHAAARAAEAEGALAERIARQQATIAAQIRDTEGLRQEREALLGRSAALRRERGDAMGRLQTTERDLAVARERLASLERQQAEVVGEQEQQEAAITAAESQVAALESRLATAEAEADSGAVALDALERDQHGARQRQEREEARVRAAQREVIQAQSRLGAAQTELGRLQRQLGEKNRVLAARHDATGQARRRLEVVETQLAERRAAFEAARARVETLVAEREQVTRELAEAQGETERLRAAVADGERERRALADRLALLDEWQRNLQGFAPGVRALLRAPADGCPPLRGTLAQLIRVPAGYDAAVEAALGPLLHAVVSASAGDALQAAAWLRREGAGSALILTPEGDAPHPSAPLPDGVDALGPLAALVECPDDLRPALTRALGGAVLVRDRAAAERLWLSAHPAVPLVTLAGDVLHPSGWLRAASEVPAMEGSADATAAARAEGGMLARERELRQLPGEMERLGQRIEELRAQHARALARHGEGRARDERLRAEAKRAEAAAQELARALTGLQRDAERAAADVQLSETIAAQLEAEAQGIEQEVAATAARVAEQERAQQDAAERADDAQADLDALLAGARAQQDELASARTALAVRRQENKTLAQRAEQTRGQVRELRQQRDRRGERLRTIAEQRAQLAAAMGGQTEALALLRERARELGETLRAHDARQAELDEQQHAIEREQGAQREELGRVEVEYRRALLEAQRARDAVEALAAQMREELSAEDEADPLALLADEADGDEAAGDEAAGREPGAGTPAGAAGALSPEELSRLRRQIDGLRARIKHLGGYDPEAPAAYEELKTRHDFLTGQLRDMEQASTNLRAIIAELDTTMRRQFEETFRAVNERFQRHFTTLFSGGAARLELTAPRRPSEDDDADDDAVGSVPRKLGLGGIEIFVQIPGKRVQDLALLSGGERAMVSVALLFALLETNPPPFCLLDEVDAALDEANVVRFCDILRQLAERTQFIVITHNRVTMTHADTIYGVSMGTDSVSRVLSLKLAEVPLTR